MAKRNNYDDVQILKQFLNSGTSPAKNLNVSKQIGKRVKMGSSMAADSVLSGEEDNESEEVKNELSKSSGGRKEVVRFEEDYFLRTDSQDEFDSARSPLKKSRHSDFYYKLESLNEKINVY